MQDVQNFLNHLSAEQDDVREQIESDQFVVFVVTPIMK